MPNWKQPLALQLPGGKILPARNANLDIDGAGKGKIGIRLFGREVVEPNRIARLAPEDIGAYTDWVDELTGKSTFGQIINVPFELLDDTIYDPDNGRMRVVPELEVRRREQAAASGGQDPAPVSGKFLVTVNPDGSATIEKH